ncbi:hypothetical protein FE810_12810 [Thalassotalea litorea]|uniref:DUF4097 domain-containing protein n=1 Tax=Thalassotalea litorea TaxID=2020715 RepID=A0A5R9IQL5_9GAMM|nr:hypothetical protein [Thalassotalea litorea]TLU64178.1 hypothetical protein FE810_12810 [Thalassotalea litorea]
MKFNTIAAVLTSSLLLSGCIIHVGAASADVEINEQLAISSANIAHLDISAGAGSLNIVGLEGATEIQVKAEIHTTEDKDYTFTLEQDGDTAVLVAEHGSTSGFWNGDSPHINVQVTVPKHIKLTVDDGSGEMSITDINGDLDIEDGSGSMDIARIQGKVDVDDGSGSLTITQVSGDVIVNDGSGSLTLSRVGGDVNVDDGSGELLIEEVVGEVTIHDGSGSITVKDAGGLTITEAGSGGLNVTGVKGGFNIGS